MILFILIFAILGCSSPTYPNYSQESSSIYLCKNKEWIKFEKKQTIYIENLSQAVFASVKRVDTSYPVFHGSVDWHSSVHGYWALIRASKYSQNNQYLDFVIDTFNSTLLDKERLYLKNNKDFEMPYGRAWFLRLAIEYESVTKLKTLRLMADEVAQSMVDYYKIYTPVPGLGEYDNAEWAFRNLYDYAVFTKNKEMIKFVNSNINLFLDTDLQFSIENDSSLYPEFFSRFGNYFHLLEVLVDSETFIQILDSFGSDNQSMAPVTLFKNNHHFGINFSRSWGLWSIYKKTNNINYQNAYLDNVIMGLQDFYVYEKDYKSYGHWVPQFGIYAVTYPLE